MIVPAETFKTPDWIRVKAGSPSTRFYEINDILRSEDVKKAFEGQGMDPASDTPDGFARLVARDADRWAALIKTQGIKAE